MTIIDTDHDLSIHAGVTTPNDNRLMRVGVIGLGRMGEAFARNLLVSGFQVSVFDRQQEKREQLEQAGARAMTHLADVGGLDAVITSLPNDEAASAVALGPSGLVDALSTAAVHISMSTISPGLSRRLAERHADVGQGFAAAPVLGNPDLARERKLFIVASGDHADVAKVGPVLGALGQRIFYVGEDAGAAILIKLGANALTAMTLQSMGEVLALLRKQGIDVRDAFEVFTGSLFDGKVHKTYGGKIVDQRYTPPGMTAVLAAKDLRLALAEAESARVPMPATSLVHDRVVAMMARGWADLDWSALGLLAADDSGLGPIHPGPTGSHGDRAAS
jgi:3-hydroxyisobutyrate dehydrogenase-like beta-hydroxyacid dehydrogenase